MFDEKAKIEESVEQEAPAARPRVKVVPRYPIADKKRALEHEQWKARNTAERLLVKKEIRTWQSDWRIMQRLGDKGRELGLVNVSGRYMPMSERIGTSGSNAQFVLTVVGFVFAAWCGFYRLTGSWLPWEW